MPAWGWDGGVGLGEAAMQVPWSGGCCAQAGVGVLRIGGVSDARGQEWQMQVAPLQTWGFPGVPSSPLQLLAGGAVPLHAAPPATEPHGQEVDLEALCPAGASQTPCPAWEPVSSQPCEATFCLTGLIRVQHRSELSKRQHVWDVT